MKLDKWQQEVLDYDGDILLCTGRRVGKTYILARKAIDLMARKANTPIIMVSLTEDQAMIIMQMALHYAKETYPKLIGKEKEKPTLRTLYINHNRMIIRPVGISGDGARGFEGGVLIVDEAASMPRTFWAAAKPVLLTTNGKIWMSSTPKGKEGYFWERFNEAYNKQDPKARFKVFHKTTPEVIEEREICETWTEEQRKGALRVLEEEKREMSALEYGQEFLGQFLDDLRQFFDDDLIHKSMTLKRDTQTHRENIYMGVDIARFGGDEITYEFIQKTGENAYNHVESIVKKGQATTQTEKDIIDLDFQWNCVKVGIDAGSGALGVGIYDNLLEHSTMKRKVVAMNNRSISLKRDGSERQRIFKEDMYFNLRAMLEKRELKLLDDDNIRLALKSVQVEYEKDGTARIFGSYTHIVEGLVRAAWLARKEKVNKLRITYF